MTAAPFTPEQEARIRAIAREEAIGAVVAASEIMAAKQAQRLTLCPSWVAKAVSDRERADDPITTGASTGAALVEPRTLAEYLPAQIRRGIGIPLHKRGSGR